MNVVILTMFHGNTINKLIIYSFEREKLLLLLLFSQRLLPIQVIFVLFSFLKSVNTSWKIWQ